MRVVQITYKAVDVADGKQMLTANADRRRAATSNGNVVDKAWKGWKATNKKGDEGAPVGPELG